MKNIIVFGFSEGRCPYCDRAKDVLKEEGLEFTFKDVSDSNVKDELLKLRGLDTLKGQTVPQIFIDGEYIGGYTDLVKLL